MTFLIDPPLLFVLGGISYLIGDPLATRTHLPVAKILATFSLCIIIFTSTSLYLNMSYMDWFWLPFQPAVSSGRDLMINSGIFSFDYVNTAGITDVLAFIQVLLFPIWTYMGIRTYLALHR
jgi:hypothetical protein